MREALERVLQPFIRRVQMIITPVEITRVKEDRVQISVQKGESYDDIERQEHFGHCYNPPIGTRAVLSSSNGNREDGILVVTSGGKYRIKNLGEGETAVYSSHGQHIVFKNNGDVEINQAEKVVFNGKEFDLKFEDKISAETGQLSLNVEENTEIITPKFKVQNDTGELVSLLAETNATLEGATVFTIFGMMPIIPGSRTFGQIKTDVITFMGGSGGT